MLVAMRRKRLVETIADEMRAESGLVTISEGIDIDYDHLLVSFNPSHEDNVDTSLDGNPTVDNNTVPGVSIWSIFKRKGGNRLDGNPLAYALKGERGWGFKSPGDREALDLQFSAIADKFLQTHSYNVTLVVPSSNALNNFIAETIVGKAPETEVIEGFVSKLTTEEVEDMVLQPGSKFRQKYGSFFNAAFAKLGKYLDLMDETKDSTFIRHLVKDPEMRNVLDSTFKLSGDFLARDANKINGADVLIVDDVVSRGQTISEIVKILRDSYAPKSVTVLTLLSKLY